MSDSLKWYKHSPQELSTYARHPAIVQTNTHPRSQTLMPDSLKWYKHSAQELGTYARHPTMVQTNTHPRS